MKPFIPREKPNSLDNGCGISGGILGSGYGVGYYCSYRSNVDDAEWYIYPSTLVLLCAIMGGADA